MLRSCIYTVIVLGCSIRVQSQEYLDRISIDSFKKSLPVATDTYRITTLNRLSRQILASDPVNGYHAAAGGYNDEMVQYKFSRLDNILHLFKSSADWYSAAGCYEVIAQCLKAVGKNTMAIQYFDSAQQMFEKAGDTTTSIWPMLEKTHSYYYLGNYLSAYKTIRAAQEKLHAKDTVLQSFALGNLGKLFIGVNIPEESINCYKKVQQLYPGSNKFLPSNAPWTYLWAIKIAGEAYLKLNRADSALAIARWMNIPLSKQQPEDNFFTGSSMP